MRDTTGALLYQVSEREAAAVLLERYASGAPSAELVAAGYAPERAMLAAEAGQLLWQLRCSHDATAAAPLLARLRGLVAALRAE